MTSAMIAPGGEFIENKLGLRIQPFILRVTFNSQPPTPGPHHHFTLSSSSSPSHHPFTLQSNERSVIQQLLNLLIVYPDLLSVL